MKKNEDISLKIDPIHVKMQKLSNRIANSSRIFILNYAFDELKNHIKIDMQDSSIKAIVVYDNFFEENIVIAYKDHKNNIVLLDSKIIPKSFDDYKIQRSKITDQKEYSSTDLGEIRVYYDKNIDISISNLISLNKEEKKYLANKEEIRLCIDPDWMPFEKIKKDRHIGITSDYMKVFSKMIDKDIVLVKTSTWVESLDKLRDNKCDIISLVSKTKEREAFMAFTSAYVNTPIVMATKIGIPFVDNIKSVLNKKLGVVKGYSLHEVLRQKYPNINLVEVDSVHDGLRKVERGEIFGYLDNTIVINYEIEKSFSGLTVTGKLDESVDLSIGVAKGEAILRDIFEKAINLLDDNIKQTILNKWVKVTYSIKTDYTLLIQLIIVFLIIIFIVFYWNRKLTALNKQLSMQRDKANQATKSKSDFLANMSHEIRTPMNGIIGMTELALKAKSEVESKKYIMKIDKSTKLLLGIINDILDFSKIEANKLQIEKVQFDLVETVDSIVDLFEFRIKSKNLKLIKELDLDKHSFYVGDSLRVSQILSNFLTNAIKFTSSGYIRIKIEDLKDGNISFCVEDTGIGLTEQEQEKLFKPFTQSDGSITRQYGGTGLGLAISKQLVKLMEGEIWVESQKDLGSKFFFKLELQKVKKTKEEINEEDLNKQEPNLEGLKILLVEDNIINQEIILGLLEDEGVSIDIANNGKEAVDIFKQNSQKYNMILMDIQMPLMDGIEATKIIRKSNTIIPIIALSANIVEKDSPNSKSIGINDYLLKPIDFRELKITISKYI